MRGKPDRTRLYGRTVSESETINASLLSDGLLNVSQAGINLKLQKPDASLAGREAMIANTTPDWLTMSQEDSLFIGGLRHLPLGPYESAMLEYNKSEVPAGLHIAVSGIPMPGKAQTSTPTLVWTTHDATVTSNVMTYSLYKGICFFTWDAAGTDGADATQVTASLPFTPQYVQTKVFCTGVKKIGTSQTDCVPYVAADQSTAASRVLTLGVPATFTDDAAWEIHVEGWFPVYGFSAYTPTLDWVGGPTPGSLTTAFAYKNVDGFMFVCGMTISADNNAATGLTFTLPENVPPDTGNYIAASSGVLSNTTWTNGLGYLDADNATEASRLFGFGKWPTMTDGQAMAAGLAIIYPMDGGLDFSDWADATWTTATPASVATVARYGMFGREYCWFDIYLSSADGNASTGVVCMPPMIPAYSAEDIRVNCYALTGTTASMPQAYIAASEADPADRKIKMDASPTFADAGAAKVRLSGFFRVAA